MKIIIEANQGEDTKRRIRDLPQIQNLPPKIVILSKRGRILEGVHACSICKAHVTRPKQYFESSLGRPLVLCYLCDPQGIGLGSGMIACRTAGGDMA